MTVTARFASYAVGARYLAARGYDVVDLGRPGGLFIDSVAPQALHVLDLAVADEPDLVLIDGEFLLPVALAHMPVPVVYLANPHDLQGEPANHFQRVNRLLLTHADAVMISSLSCTEPTPRPHLVPGTPCLEVPAITKHISPTHHRVTGPPRVLISTGGGSVGAHPGFHAATQVALASVLDALSEHEVRGQVGKVTVVLGADARLPDSGRDRPERLHVIDEPVELADLYAHHELLIARAGRNTAAEAARCGIPTVLLPVTADPHRGGEQVANAAAVSHLPGVFPLPDWRHPQALGPALAQALSYARRGVPRTGHGSNDGAAAFVLRLLADADTLQPMIMVS
jgi:UDP:flavonoid glycosyltransferase YjiC (YdhE family)